MDTFYGKLAANSYQLRSMSEYIQFLDYEVSGLLLDIIVCALP